ncbi:type VI secretion system lipoprotein TssJ [Aquabacterium sp. UBA2148]|uniref:type VI secretion system lipoprotein TssJ n=1 Tax=Aquabacterium sp. UBA2148 TaxID=1946042 RepID=UPI0025804A70|nr:type VI secretion system lipoprotein TssJ [Aquabacterium sp. UBA2148]
MRHLQRKHRQCRSGVRRDERLALSTTARSICMAWLLLSLSACGTAPGRLPPSATETSGVSSWLEKAGDKALELTGLKKPEVPDSALPDRRITWRLHASPSLNTLPDGQSLSLLVRVYRLRAPDSFLQAPADTFGDPALEKERLGDDLVSVREVQLVPGQRHEATDKLPRDIAHVGIVALYRQPVAGRWRYAFPANQAEITGIEVGLHACAMTVHTGQAVGVSSERVRSASVACPGA